MPFFAYVPKVFTSVWSVVREMVLSGESFMQVLRVNRRRAIFSIIVMASFIFSLVSLGADARFVSILISYVKLQRQYQNLETQYHNDHKDHGKEPAPDLPVGNAVHHAHSDAPASTATSVATSAAASGPVAELRSVLTDWSSAN